MDESTTEENNSNLLQKLFKLTTTTTTTTKWTKLTLRQLKRVLRLKWVQRFLSLYLTELIKFQSECVSEDWTSPIYVFFRREPWIEQIDSHRVHVFECAAARCRGKNGRDVCRFLDTDDSKSKSTSGLRNHAKKCWGDEAVEITDSMKDLENAHAVLSTTKLCDGSITAQFQCAGKGQVTFLIISICQRKLGKILLISNTLIPPHSVCL